MLRRFDLHALIQTGRKAQEQKDHRLANLISAVLLENRWGRQEDENLTVFYVSDRGGFTHDLVVVEGLAIPAVVLSKQGLVRLFITGPKTTVLSDRPRLTEYVPCELLTGDAALNYVLDLIVPGSAEPLCSAIETLLDWIEFPAADRKELIGRWARAHSRAEGGAA